MTNQNQITTDQADVSYEDVLNKDILELIGAQDLTEVDC